MTLHHVFTLLSLWLGLAAAAHSHLHKGAVSSEPLPPSQDPWYTAPEGWENKKPGAVLRLRFAPGNLTRMAGNSSATYNILYRTTDSQYKPTWAVTTLFVPQLGPNSTSAALFYQGALLSYQAPYDTADVDASPSYLAYSQVAASSIELINDALSFGVFISIPDYEGPLASFTAGVMSGHATLDSIRAILSLDLGLNMTSPRVALWGYSGGALASEWASELAEHYAPDLRGTVVGAAIGGLTPNILAVLYAISGKEAAGLAPSSILGITSQYPDVQKYVISQLKTSGKYNKAAFLAAKKYNLVQAGDAFEGEDIFDFFKNGKKLFTEPCVKRVIDRDGVMGYHGVPKWPIFAYQGINDEVSPITNTDKLIERYCGDGANILYQRNTVGTHAENYVLNSDAAVGWLLAVLMGQYAESYKTEGCTIQNVTLNSTDVLLRKRGMPSKVSDLLGNAPIKILLLEADQEARRSNLEYEVHSNIKVIDLRGQEKLPSLGDHGFEIFIHKPIVDLAVPSDEEMNKYLEDLAVTVKDHLKAEAVLAYSFRFRREQLSQDARDTKNPMGTYLNQDTPILVPHTDQTREGALRRTRRHLNETEIEKYLDGSWRIRIVNCWRPIRSTADERPLAMCDFYSLDEKDLQPAERASRQYVGEIYYAHYNPMQKWY
ncbi:lipase 4 [Fusarium sp. NRRL 52700]|nr:lipase 4 [Fusarium sp. NRRL 52700]